MKTDTDRNERRRQLPTSWDEIPRWIESLDLNEKDKLAALKAFQPLIQAYATHAGQVMRLERSLGEALTEIEERAKAFDATYNYFEGLLHKFQEELNKAQEMAYKASMDRATQLPRKEYFYDKLRESLEFERRDQVCVLALFDVGELKSVNDVIGHKMGNFLLARAAKTLRTEMRSEIKLRVSIKDRLKDQRCPLLDLKARLGGDEFGAWIVLDHKKIQETEESVEGVALRIVERCCAKFDEIDWPGEYTEWQEALAKNPEKVSMIKPMIDPGVVIIHTGPLPRIRSDSARDHLEKLMDLADDRMYESKRYRKAYGHRRIFYNQVEFKGRSMRIEFEGFYDPPKISK